MAENKESVSLFQLFKFADHFDKWLLFFGILGSVGDGLMNPLTMIVLAGAINDYGNTDIKLTNHVVDKVSLVKESILVEILGFMGI